MYVAYQPIGEKETAVSGQSFPERLVQENSMPDNQPTFSLGIRVVEPSDLRVTLLSCSNADLTVLSAYRFQ